MAKTKCSRSDIIEQLLRKHKYSEAEERLRSIDVSRLSSMDIARYYIQRSIVNIYTNPTDAYNDTLILRALKAAENNKQSHVFAEAKLVLGLIRYRTACYDDAAELLNEASVAFRNLADTYHLAKTLNLLGLTLGDRGEFEPGLTCLLEAHSLFNEAREGKSASALSFNIGLFCIWRGRICDGFRRLKQYRQLTEGTELANPLPYYSNIAWVHAVFGQFQAAQDCLRKANGLVSSDIRWRVFLKQIAGNVAEMRGDLNSALMHYSEGLVKAEDIGLDLRFSLLRHRADVSAKLDLLDGAEEDAHQALTAASERRDLREVAATNRTLGFIALKRKQAATGLIYLEDARKIFEQINSLYELAVTRWLAATHAGCPPEEATVLYALAREYFSRETIPWKDGKIQSVDASAKEASSRKSSRYHWIGRMIVAMDDGLIEGPTGH